MSDCEISLSSPFTPFESLGDEAERILRFAETKSVTLRLLGGVAVGLRCPSASKAPLSRRYVDIDVIGHSKDTGKITQLFKELGYKPRERFNALQVSRLIFNDIKNSRRVDVFLDVFQMCHKFDLKNRIELEPKTIPISDLLSTKLQIVEINEKDIKDILAMLLDHDISAVEVLDKINATYIARLCAEDWGVYKTFTINLGRLAEDAIRLGLEEEQRKRSSERAEALRKAIEEEPKTVRWKMRAVIGEKKRWYELPWADQEVVESGVRAEI
ncbi:MAG: hypothetical protein LYZ69_06850 [Nitrososphaerales archaeon]|nr:hypothetical protein [Nitrososphaerales archaeon]